MAVNIPDLPCLPSGALRPDCLQLSALEASAGSGCVCGPGRSARQVQGHYRGNEHMNQHHQMFVTQKVKVNRVEQKLKAAGPDQT